MSKLTKFFMGEYLPDKHILRIILGMMLGVALGFSIYMGYMAYMHQVTIAGAIVRSLIVWSIALLIDNILWLTAIDENSEDNVDSEE